MNIIVKVCDSALIRIKNFKGDYIEESENILGWSLSEIGKQNTKILYQYEDDWSVDVGILMDYYSMKYNIKNLYFY